MFSSILLDQSSLLSFCPDFQSPFLVCNNVTWQQCLLTKQQSVFTDRASIYANLLEHKKRVRACTDTIPYIFSLRPEKLSSVVWTLDCERSLFFFRFSESSARARERRSRETRETRGTDREEKKRVSLFRASPVSRLQSRAWPCACLAFWSTDYRKKRYCS